MFYDVGGNAVRIFGRFFRLFVIRPRSARKRSSATITWSQARKTVLRGKCWVIDGDTIAIEGTHIRLAGIDAPELDHPWGRQAKWALVQMCKGKQITARVQPDISYDRVVAECFLPDGRDLSAEMVKIGLALDWPKFSGGKYRHLEPLDARRKLWRADARQKGRMPQTALRQRTSYTPLPPGG